MTANILPKHDIGPDFHFSMQMLPTKMQMQNLMIQMPFTKMQMQFFLMQISHASLFMMMQIPSYRDADANAPYGYALM